MPQTVEAPLSQTTRTALPANDRAHALGTAVVAVAGLGLLGWILLLRNPAANASTLAFMPAVNAAFNALSATFVSLGLLAIRQRKVNRHRALMLSALGASALFLVGYLVYHYVHGDTRFPEANPLRGLYLAVLGSHVVLSIAAFPMVLWTFSLALRGQYPRHKKWARFTYPLWLYVSITGVVVFAMLRSAFR